MIMKIKKRETTLEAVQCGDDVQKSVKAFAKKHGLEITRQAQVFADGRDLITLVNPNGDNRDWTLEPGVWIVCSAGEFEAMPDSIFNARYEAAL